MTAPKLTTLGVVLSVGDGFVFLTADEPPNEDALAIKATEDEQRAWSELLMTEGAVRITIEPASAPEQAAPVEAPPTHGSPLDYLAQAKRLIESGELGAYVTGTGQEFPDSEDATRLLSLLNSAHIAILTTQRGTR